MWSSPERESRHEIHLTDLGEMDLLDSSGHEIPIYTENGFQIERRAARWRPGHQPHGVLVDLRHLDDLFTADDDNLYEDGRPGPAETKYSVYPQAGMRTVGHFQANGLMTKFYPRLAAINKRMTEAMREELDGDELDEEVSRHLAVTGVSSQGYNAIMHSTRGTSNQHHDAQLGLITSALAGAWATQGNMKTKAHKLQTRCANRLPHVQFSDKISKEAIERDLRLENVYSIDLFSMPKAQRHGL